jgi:hypothetical protein
MIIIVRTAKTLKMHPLNGNKKMLRLEVYAKPPQIE